MAVTVARDCITCRVCGAQRVVTDRSRRRSEQNGGIPCASCRGLSPTTVKVSEGDLRFWLRSFGVDLPRSAPVREFIVAGGAPEGLVELARQCYPEVL